jgi:coenzyme Q-binding protein COQ10
MPSHAETRIVPYRPEQMFDLVADVGSYPRFLPWCAATRVRSRADDAMLADMTIGFGPFRETFLSRVALDRPSRIVVAYERGPFAHLRNLWEFRPADAGAEIAFEVDFAFRSRVLEAAIGTVFDDAVRRMVGAFLARADALHGAAARLRST